MQTHLSALVVHDIKNSLALLELELEQLNHHDGLPVEARKAYSRCVELKNRLMGFLTLYKQEHGGLKPCTREIDLREFLDDLLDTSQSVAMGGHKHGRSLQVVVAESRIDVAPDVALKGVGFFDEHLLDMALESALSNAVRYAHQRVELWFEQEAHALTFYVQDDGPGVSSEQGLLQRARSDNASSTGLGLALCQAVAEVHGAGVVSLINLAAGGTLFSIRLGTPIERHGN
jgi:signal transduction histidine kinase